MCNVACWKTGPITAHVKFSFYYEIGTCLRINQSLNDSELSSSFYVIFLYPSYKLFWLDMLMYSHLEFLPGLENPFYGPGCRFSCYRLTPPSFTFSRFHLAPCFANVENSCVGDSSSTRINFWLLTLRLFLSLITKIINLEVKDDKEKLCPRPGASSVSPCGS